MAPRASKLPPRRRKGATAPGADEVSRAPSAGVVITESCPSRSVRHHATANRLIVTNEDTPAVPLTSAFADAMRGAFLPVGYPASVRPLYLEFQMYDTLQAACSYLRWVLTTSAILQAAYTIFLYYTPILHSYTIRYSYIHIHRYPYT